MRVYAIQEPWASPGGADVTTWSVGRTFVVLPTAGDQRACARVRDTGYGLARLGPTGSAAGELWELPVVWTPTTLGTNPQVVIELLSAGNRETLTIPVLRPATIAAREVGADVDDDAQENSAAFDAVLDHHVEAVRHWLDGAEEQTKDLIGRASGHTLVPLETYCERYWQLEGSVEAPLTLIVRIALEIGPLVEQLANSPRTILRRDRKLVPIGRAQQVDAPCLRWLTRQPGRTTAQRAGPRQLVRAVVREPSIDTLENRVLRHFLELCRIAASRYLRSNSDHHASPRLDVVRRLRTIADRLLRQAPVGRVGQLARIPDPNYVLQFDARYGIIWTWYVRLIRQEQEKDDLRAWHQRVWAERCKTAVLSTLETECVRPHSLRGQVALRHEAQEGCFLASASSFGPWAFLRTPRQHVIRMIDRNCVMGRSAIASLARFAFEFVLVCQSPFNANEISAALAVFTIFSPEDNDREFFDRLERLDRALHSTFGASLTVPIGAMVLTPHTGGTRALQMSHSQRVIGCRLPMPNCQGERPGWESLRRILRAFTEPGAS